MKIYEIKKLMTNGSKKIIATCSTEKEALTELEKIFNLHDTFYISEKEVIKR